MTQTTRWIDKEGKPLSCKDKLATLDDNLEELLEVALEVEANVDVQNRLWSEAHTQSDFGVDAVPPETTVAIELRPIDVEKQLGLSLWSSRASVSRTFRLLGASSDAGVGAQRDRVDQNASGLH